MYRAREQADILRDLQERSKTPASKIEGTFEYDVLASNSIEFGKVEVELEEAYRVVFAESSWGEYLTMRAAEHGVLRKTATKARGVVTVTGNGRVLAGSIFQSETGARYQALKSTEVVKSAAVEVEALTAGSAGNVGKRAINKIPMSIPGISGVSNEEELRGGYDEESDDELKMRYLLYVRTPSTSGNKHHYYNWAMSVPGVGACMVVPLWQGAGTVKVLILDAQRKTAPSELIEKVRTYIEDVRPIGATVTVISPAPKTVRITGSIVGHCDAPRFIADLNDYLMKRELAIKSLSVAQVGDILMNQQGVTDYEDLLLNGASKVLVSNDEILSIGEVTLHELPVSP
jgi:baseplate J-like protein|nr:MAG TPA: Baseplate J like protein [Caudoviricetes sp.]